MRDRLKEFEPVFYPKSIAVVGSFNSPTRGGYLYFHNLVEAGFKGALYAVCDSENEALGHRIYHSVLDIPGTLEYVISCVPASAVLKLADECAVKGVKVIQLFTAGFSETGTPEGRRLEEELAEKAKAGGIHIVGPNCIGVSNPSINMPCGPMPYMAEAGRAAYFAQSGGNTTRAVKAGMARKLGFSKVVSYGNACDLDSPDYLEYFARDPETTIIGAYIEGIKDGRRFFGVLKEAAKLKPVVIVKGGRTSAGAAAAASHTGALATSDSVWKAAIRQAGAVAADSMDELLDTLIALDRVKRPGRNVALISGLAAGGGGDSVLGADACLERGLKVPPFSAEIKSRLDNRVKWPGVITRNPLDVSSLGGRISTLEYVLEAIGDETTIDVIIIQTNAADLIQLWLKTYGRSDGVQRILETIINFAKSGKKPVMVVLPHEIAEDERSEMEATLCTAGIATYPGIERAAKALENVCAYFEN